MISGVFARHSDRHSHPGLAVAATVNHCYCQVCTTVSCARDKPQSCHLSPEGLPVGSGGDWG